MTRAKDRMTMLPRRIVARLRTQLIDVRTVSPTLSAPYTLPGALARTSGISDERVGISDERVTSRQAAAAGACSSGWRRAARCLSAPSANSVQPTTFRVSDFLEEGRIFRNDPMSALLARGGCTNQ